jgi:hypothetical protein
MKIENEKKVCESCNKEFLCGANAGNCWCFTETIDAESLANIANEFSNCLCPDCLTVKHQEAKI